MSADGVVNVVMLVIAAATVVYLTIALVNPERF